MRIGSLCRRRLITIDRGATLAEAASLMREHRVGALLVTGLTSDGLAVAGILTDRDVVIHALAEGIYTEVVTAGDLAPQPTVSVSEDEDASVALAAMQAHGVRRLLVTDAQQCTVGMLSLEDLLLAYAGEMAVLAGVIRSGIEREASESAAAKSAPLPACLHLPTVGTAAWGAPMA